MLDSLSEECKDFDMYIIYLEVKCFFFCIIRYQICDTISLISVGLVFAVYDMILIWWLYHEINEIFILCSVIVVRFLYCCSTMWYDCSRVLV